MTKLYDFSLTHINGNELPLSAFDGKVVLIVNVASKCGFTKQYTGLQKAYSKYNAQGFEILGIPCNQFGNQEPGTEEEIQNFCDTMYRVTFPMSSKIEVNGQNQHPLYVWLTSEKTTPESSGDIPWNFTKFLIGREGSIAGRFSPETEPTDTKLIEKIESLL